MAILKIISISPESQTMVIDWGDATLNHFIPDQILDGENLTEEETLAILELMRPEQVVTKPIPAVLSGLVQPAVQPDNFLLVDKNTLTADNVDMVTATVKTSEQAVFLVDDEEFPVNPVDGVATLEIKADAKGFILLQYGPQIISITAV